MTTFGDTGALKTCAIVLSKAENRAAGLLMLLHTATMCPQVTLSRENPRERKKKTAQAKKKKTAQQDSTGHLPVLERSSASQPPHPRIWRIYGNVAPVIVDRNVSQ